MHESADGRPVGTNCLDQWVYIDLGDGDFGVGMVAGVGLAMIDDLTQAWSERRRRRLGK